MGFGIYKWIYQYVDFYFNNSQVFMKQLIQKDFLKTYSQNSYKYESNRLQVTIKISGVSIISKVGQTTRNFF